MKVPCCSVCQISYNEEDRVPLLLQCGHGFCKDCLSRMFSASVDTTLVCPRCRCVSTVGNSVQALRKNFVVLALLDSPSPSHFDGDCTDDEDDDSRWEENDGNSFSPPLASCSNRGRAVIDVASHNDVKLVKKIGEGRRSGVEIWEGLVTGGGGRIKRCKHRVAVKKVDLGEEVGIDKVQSQLERLIRASMWCRNICTYHGVERTDRYLNLVMDKCCGSVYSEMQRNEGRLSLDQILRYGADVARGVSELHAAGIICLNIKPSNLLIDSNGRALVSDYGISLIMKKQCRKCPQSSDSGKVQACMECSLLSPHYAAPEAWEPVKKSLNLFGEEALGISMESDAWSFGCTLVEMCTGSIPWAGLSAEEIHKMIFKERKLPPQYASVVGVGIPRDLWRMIGECLQFKASKRPTFSSMLSKFLRHLQDLPRSPPDSPHNGLPEPTTDDVEDERDLTPADPSHLHRLVSEGDVQGTKEFLEVATKAKGAAYATALVESQDLNGQTALHLACRRGSAALLEAILEFASGKVDVSNKAGDPPLVFALVAGSSECTRALINRGSDVCSRLRGGMGTSVAHVCAYHGQPECMREILLAGADPNAVDDDETVLHLAVSKKYTGCALAILEGGGAPSMAHLNSKSLTPLHLCVSLWNVAVVKKWLEVASGQEIADAIDVESPLGTALCMAASLKKDHETEGREIVRILLAAGANPLAQDPEGRTVLHKAAWVNDPQLVKIILESGVDVNVRNERNIIPLHLALTHGAVACVEVLLAAGADCNIQDDEGDNAFHIAADASKMFRENIELLIAMLRIPDAAVDISNHRGKTLPDLLEALPREWISEDLIEILETKGVQLSQTTFDVGDWVKFRRTVDTPHFGWQGAKAKSVGFVQNVYKDFLNISFCTGEPGGARALPTEIVKMIPLDRGQHVRLKPKIKEPRFGWRGQSRESIGTVLCVDDDGILRVGFPGASRGWKADPAEMERVEEFKVGDWVRIRPTLTSAKHGLGSVTPGSIGIVFCVRPDSSLFLQLSYLEWPWHCEPEEIEHVTPFQIGDQVCVKRSVAEPRYAWGGETHHSVGRVCEIENDGLLVMNIPNRSIPWRADPSDMEKVEYFKVGDWIRVKASVSSPKYGWDDINRSSTGIIHSLRDNDDVGIAFCFRTKPFLCSLTDIEKFPPFVTGQDVRILPSVTVPRLGWSDESPASVGKLMRIDLDGALNVKVPGRRSLWKVSPGDAEVLPGFEVGDWVRSKPYVGTRPSYDWNSVGKESVAVVHSVQDSGYLELSCCFRKGKSTTNYADVEKIQSLKSGQHVRFRRGLAEPRWGWRGAHPDSHGVIASVHADGELWISLFDLPGIFRGDPVDFEVEDIFDVGQWVRLRESAPSWKSIHNGSIGVVHGFSTDSARWDRDCHVAFCGEQELWMGPASCLEKTEKFVVGEKVRAKESLKQLRFGWSGHSMDTVGTISSIDGDGKLRICSQSATKIWMMDPSDVEVVKEEVIDVGDWVRVKASVSAPTHQWGDVNRSSVGVVHRVDDGELFVAFCFSERLWVCKATEMEVVRPFSVGDMVKIRTGVMTPRWGWGMETSGSRGSVVGVDANGLLRVSFQWRDGQLWVLDPADVELI